ncbi:MAG: hypothetical protein JEZ03_18520 [Bacteroidales bacterium]|nr:hypothetical protein [Bacteroidales bacterium]
MISIDGNAFNNSYRVLHNGKEYFPMVYENILKVKRQYSEFFETNVKINSVLHYRNSAKEIFEFTKNEFALEPIISEVSTDGLIDEKKDEFADLFKNIIFFTGLNLLRMVNQIL